MAKTTATATARPRSDCGARSALEACVTDHLSRRLQVAAELVELDVLPMRRARSREDRRRLDTGGERVLERLIREVSLRLLLEQEADQLDGFVLAVGAPRASTRR